MCVQNRQQIEFHVKHSLTETQISFDFNLEEVKHVWTRSNFFVKFSDPKSNGRFRAVNQGSTDSTCR